MIKTRHQLNHLQNHGVFKTLVQIYSEGGFFRFYRGMSAELVGIVPKSSAMYASYEMALTRIKSWHFTENSSVACSLAGCFSGVPEALVVQPTQVVKVRLQAKEHLGKYSGSVDCLVKIVRSEGVKGLTIGLGPTLYRNCVWNTVNFGTMDFIKGFLPWTIKWTHPNISYRLSGRCFRYLFQCTI